MSVAMALAEGSNAPRRSMETEASQCHHSERRPTGTEERRRPVLRAGFRRGSGACEGDTAGSARGSTAAGAGPAARRGADDRVLRACAHARSRRSCAVDGGTDGGCPADPRHPEQVIEVPMISLQDGLPWSAVLREPQVAEQLVQVPVPSFSTCAHAPAEIEEEILALARDATGRTWFHVRGPRGAYWWM